MNEQELTELRERYRSVGAPADLAAGIRARASRQPARSRRGWLLPLASGIVGVLALAAALPLLIEDDKASIPSMAELASAMPDKPALTVPSVGSLKLPARPALPTRPLPATAPAEPETNEDTGARLPGPRSPKERTV